LYSLHEEPKQVFIPTKALLTRGRGFHKNELQSYELALRDAGIEKLNLVSVSSIFPPDCEIIPREEALPMLQPGKITFCVMARLHTNEYGRMVGASIGIAFPSDRNNYGYISEYHAYGKDETELGDFAEDLASTMLATTLGVEFDPDKDYDERRQIYLMSGKVVEALSLPCLALGEKGGYVTVVSCVVFVA
jgi:arginine decarboxylase